MRANIYHFGEMLRRQEIINFRAVIDDNAVKKFPGFVAIIIRSISRVAGGDTRRNRVASA